MSQSFLSQNEITHGKAKGHIGIYGYLVQDMVQLFLLVLVENVSVLWLMSHIQLHIVSWLDICQHFVVVHLAFYQGEHAVANAHYWEMLIWLFIKSLCPQ